MMADVLCAGFHAARDAGLLIDAADIRVAIALPGIAVDPDALHPSDTNLTTYEYDGVGYGRAVLAGVSVAYDATSDEWQVDADDDADAFGTTVLAASAIPEAVVFILHVTDDTDSYVLGKVDSGSISNGNGGALALNLPADGFLFSEQA
jgi:hypothetical protein